MEPDTSRENQPSLIVRIWRSIRREPLWPEDDRGRMRLAMNDLILHLHPPRVPAKATRFTYTFGLGGMAALLLMILVSTGLLLMFAYTPSPDEAYGSIVDLETEIYFGQLIRNLHHWSGNLLLIVAFLHMLRVFYTAAFVPPREFNWQLGLALLGLIAFANFTGYLLPWDQLSYWAVTVAASLIGHIPLVGESIRRLLIGSEEVSGTTLSTFFALHVIVIPLLMLFIFSFHIWRVRKDKFTVPRDLNESEESRTKMVTTIPHLVSIEMVFALIVIAGLLTWATWVDAPLQGAANPNDPPNPSKAAWYFIGVQELLLHFHPTFGVVVIPGLTILALISLPYLRDDMDATGIWFRSRQGRWLTALSFVGGIIGTAGLVLIRENWLNLPETFPDFPTWISNGVIPLGAIMLMVYGYARLLRWRGVTRSETRQALVTLLIASIITLTIIGVFFRGEDMALMWPSEV
ncbi:MAG: cytochrome bc complex cytochrome b subunit [Chloroflexi bacterium]|nr:cytochrome bc complex cytochrome b subunit [Chloroflexota bacterium]